MSRSAFEGATWHKSSRSQSGDCVEVALIGDVVGLRDSKNPDQGVLAFSPREWSAFVQGVKRGDFDLG